MEDVTETRHLEAQRRLFERMVSPVVIEQLNPDELNLGGTRSLVSSFRQPGCCCHRERTLVRVGQANPFRGNRVEEIDG